VKCLVIIFIAAAAVTGGALHAQSKDSSTAMRWNSFDAGLEKAKASHKKVLVDVYTEWCGWCKKMDTEVYTDPGIKDYLSKNFIIIKMNAEGTGKIHYKGQEYSPGQLAAAFGVNGYPATLFLRDDSEPITLFPGYAEPPMFLLVLSFIAEDQYQKKQFGDYLKEKGVKQ
jgi:thioredoxin-related protein